MNFAQFQTGDHVAFERTFHPEDFMRFSELSEDRNSLHWDDEVGRKSEFGSIIVPLFLATSPFSAIAGMALPGEPSLILQQSFDAIQPVKYGERLSYSARIEQCLPAKRVLKLSLLVSSGNRILINGSMATQCRTDSWSDPAAQEHGHFELLRAPRLALVTGASGAIGSATVRTLLADGWDVWPVFHHGSPDLPFPVKHIGQPRQPWRTDLRNSESLDKLCQAIAEDTPSLVVHCASAPYDSDVHALTATNFIALERLYSACLPAFLKRQSGRFINLGSIAQRNHPALASTYASAKEMGAHLLDGLNHRYGRYGIRSVTLMPDRVRSNYGAGLGSSSGLILEPEEVAMGIAQLANVAHPESRYLMDSGGLSPIRYPNQENAGHAVPSAESNPEPGEQPESGDLLGSRLRKVFNQVLPLSTKMAEASLKLGEVEGWDSLSHIKLMLEIESLFQIDLSSQDISETMSFKEILELVSRKRTQS